MDGRNSISSAFRNPRRAYPFVLIAAGIAAYANSFSGPFIFDDKPAIPDNPHVLHLWPIWDAMRWPDQSTLAGRPLVAFSFAVNYALSGFNVWSYHALNLAIHLAAGLTLYGIARRTLLLPKLQTTYGSALPPSDGTALAIALLWLLHPLQTESVTYIVQRVESLMGLFYLLTLFCSIRSFDSSRRALWQIAAVLACALGMTSKEVMATAPLIVLLYDRIFIFRSWRGQMKFRWKLYAGLGATWLILAALVRSGPRSNSAGFGLKSVAPIDYAKSQFGIIAHYLKLSLLPHPLVLDYKWPVASSLGDVLPWAILIFGLLGLTLFALRFYPWAGFLGAWFFVILAPTSTFIPIADLAFEHRMYLPLAAVMTMAAACVQWMVGRRAATPFLIIVALTSSLLTIHRNRDYRTEISIFSDVVAKRPNNARGHHNLAVALENDGRYDEAVAEYGEAIDQDPQYADAYVHLGNALLELKKTDQAEAAYRMALQFAPEHSEGHNNLGTLLAEEGKMSEAREQFILAIHFNPQNAEAQKNLRTLEESESPKQ